MKSIYDGYWERWWHSHFLADYLASSQLLLKIDKNLSMVCEITFVHIKRVATFNPFSPWRGPAQNSSLLTQLLFWENLDGIVGVVFLVVPQLYPPIAAQTHNPLKRVLENTYIYILSMNPSLSTFTCSLPEACTDSAGHSLRFVRKILALSLSEFSVSS